MTAIMEAVGLRVAVAGRVRSHLFRTAPPIEIVRGVDLSLARGSALGLVGESGSGKTTLGRTLVRLLRPSEGRLMFDGIDITDLDEPSLHPLRARMQMIFQDPHSSLNPRLIVSTILRRPLEAFGRLSGGAARRVRVAELLDLVGLPAGLADRYPHELSGGQRQRVGIARAIALEPDFIVADEIVSGLGCLHPGANPRSVARPAPAAWPDLGIYQPRFVGGAGALRSSRGAAAGRDRRGRTLRRSVCRAAPRVYKGLDRCHSVAGFRSGLA